MEGALRRGTAPLYTQPHINISKWYHKVNTVSKVLKDRSTRGLCMVWKLEPVPSSAAAGGTVTEGMVNYLGAKWVMFTLLRERPLLPTFPHIFKVDSKGCQLSSRHCPLKCFFAKKDLFSVSGVAKLENPKIHNQYTTVCSGNIVGIAQGGNGETPREARAFCDLVLQRGRSVSEENTHRGEKEYSSRWTWRETWVSYAQVSGAVTHSRLQRQRKTVWAVYSGIKCNR